MRREGSASGAAPPLLHVTIGCDVDPDRIPSTRRREAGDSPDDYWVGLHTGIPRVRELLDALGAQVAGERLRVTWLLRSDRQMEEFFGDPAYPARRFRDLWRGLADGGDEIGWHPHLYRWDPSGRRWEPALADSDSTKNLRGAHEALNDLFTLQSTRTGWDFQSTALMGLFESVGISLDFSALPQQRHFYSAHAYCDWLGTGEDPYLPSRLDYRLPARVSEGSWNVLEVPVSSHPSSSARRLLGWLAHNLRCLTYLPAWRSGPIPHYRPGSIRFQTRLLTSDPRSFIPTVERALARARARGGGVFVTYFHATTDTRALANLGSNLSYLWSRCSRVGVVPRSRRASELRSALDASSSLPRPT